MNKSLCAKGATKSGTPATEMLQTPGRFVWGRREQGKLWAYAENAAASDSQILSIFMGP